MQTCSRCNQQSPDMARVCVHCEADLSEWSTTAQAFSRLRNNPRVRLIQVVVDYDCCPACRDVEGAYPKDQVPILPVVGCSHESGCRCFYQPVLDEIYP